MTPLSPADHAALGAALAHAAAPADVYRAAEKMLAEHLGFGLFTMLVRTPDGEQVRRIFTTNAAAYPLDGCKRMGPTPWGALVLERKQCFVTGDADGIRWAFPDHELIASLGLASAINVPLVVMGQVLGTINVLDAAGRYTESDLPVVQAIGPYLVAPFLREIEQT